MINMGNDEWRKAHTIEDTAIPRFRSTNESLYFAFLKKRTVRIHEFWDVKEGRTKLAFVGRNLSSTPTSSVIIVMSVYPQRSRGMGGKGHKLRISGVRS